MRERLAPRADTSAAWAQANPILGAAELVFDTDRQDFKIGDGLRAWLQLPYLLGQQLVFRGLFVPGGYLAGQYVEAADGFCYVARRTIIAATAQPSAGSLWRRTAWGPGSGGGTGSGTVLDGATLSEWEPKSYDGSQALVVVLFNFTMFQLTVDAADFPFDSQDITLEIDYGQWTPICCETQSSPLDPGLYLLTEDGRRITDEQGQPITID